jgi:hypothetical protein
VNLTQFTDSQLKRLKNCVEYRNQHKQKMHNLELAFVYGKAISQKQLSDPNMIKGHKP